MYTINWRKRDAPSAINALRGVLSHANRSCSYRACKRPRRSRKRSATFSYVCNLCPPHWPLQPSHLLRPLCTRNGPLHPALIGFCLHCAHARRFARPLTASLRLRYCPSSFVRATCTHPRCIRCQLAEMHSQFRVQNACISPLSLAPIPRNAFICSCCIPPSASVITLLVRGSFRSRCHFVLSPYHNCAHTRPC